LGKHFRQKKPKIVRISQELWDAAGWQEELANQVLPETYQQAFPMMKKGTSLAVDFDE
jgi:hypothetical protein